MKIRINAIDSDSSLHRLVETGEGRAKYSVSIERLPDGISHGIVADGPALVQLSRGGFPTEQSATAAWERGFEVDDDADAQTIASSLLKENKATLV